MGEAKDIFYKAREEAAAMQKRNLTAMKDALNPTGLKRGEKFTAHNREWMYLGYVKAGCSTMTHERHYVLGAETYMTPSAAQVVVYRKPIIKEKTPGEG